MNIHKYDNALTIYQNNKLSQYLVSIFYFSFICFVSNKLFIQYKNYYDLLIIITSIYFSDFVTGLPHIYFDKRKIYYDTSKMDLITDGLNNVAYGFQVHHKNPTKFIENVLITSNYGQFELLTFVSTPLYIITNCFTNSHVLVFMYTFLLVGSSAQIFHGYSHMPIVQVPYVIRVLQRYNIILSNKEHLRHHKKNDHYFTIVNGWANPLLNVVYDYILNPFMKLFPQHFEIESA